MYRRPRSVAVAACASPSIGIVYFVAWLSSASAATSRPGRTTKKVVGGKTPIMSVTSICGLAVDADGAAEVGAGEGRAAPPAQAALTMRTSASSERVTP